MLRDNAKEKEEKYLRKGREEYIRQSFEQGYKEESISIAKNLQKIGMSFDQIADVVDLS